MGVRSQMETVGIIGGEGIEPDANRSDQHLSVIPPIPKVVVVQL